MSTYGLAAELTGPFVCGEHLNQRLHFRTFAELEEHRHGEHHVEPKPAECDARPAGSTSICRKPTGHAGRHSDGCGNVWHQRGTYLCGLYHPEVEFASHAEWSEHSKAVHLNATFVEIDSNGVGRSKWWTEIDEVRPHVAQAPRLSPAEESQKQKLMRQFGRDEARLDQARRQNEAPARMFICGHRERVDGCLSCAACFGPPSAPGPIVMPSIASLPPEAQAELRRLLAEAQREMPKISPICITKEPRRALVPGELPIRCACCYAKAPQAPNLDARDLTGWSLFAFPLDETLRHGLSAREAKRLCPPCSEKVAKFIAHLSTPMLHEEDLL